MRWSREELVLLLRAWEDATLQLDAPNAADVAERLVAAVNLPARSLPAIRDRLLRLQRMFFCISDFQQKKMTAAVSGNNSEQLPGEQGDQDGWFVQSRSRQSQFYHAWERTSGYSGGSRSFMEIDAETYVVVKRIMEKQLAIKFARDAPWSDAEVLAVALALREAMGESGSNGHALTASRVQPATLYRHFKTHCDANEALRNEAAVTRKMYAVVGMYYVISKFQSQGSAADASSEARSWFACSSPEKFRFFMEVDGRPFVFVDIAQDAFEVVATVLGERSGMQHPVQSPRRELEDGEVEEDSSDEDSDSDNDLTAVYPSPSVNQATSTAPITAKSSDSVDVEVCVSTAESPRCTDVDSCETVDLTGFAFVPDQLRDEDENSSQESCPSHRALTTDLPPRTTAPSSEVSKDVDTTPSGDLVFQDEQVSNSKKACKEQELKKRKLDPDLRLVIGIFTRQVEHISDLVSQIREEREFEQVEREKFLAILHEDREDRKRDREERTQLRQLLFQGQQASGQQEEDDQLLEAISFWT